MSVKAKQSTQSKMTEFKKEFHNWSVLSHVECYPKIFQSKSRSAKCIWITFLLIFTGLTASLVIFNIEGFFSYEVVTKIETFNQVPTEFPTVTICDANPYSTRDAQDLIQNISMREIGADLFDMSFNDAYKKLPDLTELTKMYTGRPEFSKTDKQKLGFSLNQIWACIFNGKICNLTQDFRYHYSYNFGNCWQFNSGFDSYGNPMPLKTTTLQDQNFGLSISLGLSNQNKFPVSDSKGVRLYIHNNTFSPINNQGVYLKPGEKSVIALKRLFMHNHPQPYSDCQDLTSFNSELYTYLTKNLKKPYRQYDCLNLCLQKNIIRKCGCYYTRFPNLDNSRPCLNLTDWRCVSKEEQALIGENIKKCDDECPLECDTILYDTQMSGLEFPSRELYAMFSFNKTLLDVEQREIKSNFSTYELFKDNSLSLTVFYPHTEYTQITVSPKILSIDLLSQIGGSLGMFLGFSMFHVIELFEIIFLLIYILVIKK